MLKEHTPQTKCPDPEVLRSVSLTNKHAQMYNNFCEKGQEKNEIEKSGEKISVMRQFNLENIDVEPTPQYHSRKLS